MKISMIQSVSIPNNSANSLKQNKKINSSLITNKLNNAKPYVDSFVKHTKKSTPAMLALTGMWTAADTASKKAPLKKAFANNLKSFFIPVVLCSSVLLSVIDNKKTQKNNNQTV